MFEGALWGSLTALLLPLAWTVARRAREESAAVPLLALLALSVVARLVVPFAPPNWYLGTVGPHDDFFSRPSAAIPLPSQLALFHPGSELGIRLLNLGFSLGSVAFLWFAASRAGHTRRTAFVFAGFFAFVPMYVRLAASDDGVVTALLFLFSVAAAAFVELAAAPGRTWAYPLLALAVVLAMPLRLESGLLVPLVAFFGCRERVSWKGLFPNAGVAVVLVGASCVGAAWMLSVHGASLGQRPPAVLGVLQALVSGGLFIVNPAGPAFFSPLLALPVWIFVLRHARKREFSLLLAVYLPVMLASLPCIFKDGPFVMLPAARYHVLSVVFILLASARATDELLLGWAHHPPARGWRVALAVLLVPAAAALLAVPWRFTYAYQEEYLFLRATLPSEGTVVTLWDPGGGHSDIDCCLSLPYPTLRAEFPHLHWVVLGAGATDADLQALSADFYYPGSMKPLDPTTMDVWWRHQVAGEETREQFRAHRARLVDLDQKLRARFRLAPLASRNVPAHTFSFVGFAGDRLELSLFTLQRRE